MKRLLLLILLLLPFSAFGSTDYYVATDALEVSGTDNSGSDDKATSMVDTTTNFDSEGVANGDLIWNVTDASWGTITSITTTTNPNDTLNFSGGLSSGTDNDFDDGDSYIVTGDGTKGNEWTIEYALGTKDDYAKNGSEVVYIEAGTYTLSSALVVQSKETRWQGYNTTEGDLDDVWGEGSGATAKPIIATSGDLGTYLVNFGIANNGRVMNLVFDGTNNGAYDNVYADEFTYYNCVSKNSGAGGFSGDNPRMAILCIADNNTTFGFNGNATMCLSKNNGTYGFATAGTNNIAYNNSGDGFEASNTGRVFINCIADSNGGDGFEQSHNDGQYSASFINCISSNNGAWGYQQNAGDGDNLVTTINCNAYNNTSGATYGMVNINLNTDNPSLTDPANDDFSLGNTNLYGLGAYTGSMDGTGTMDLGEQKSSGEGSGGGVTLRGGITIHGSTNICN